MTKWALIGRYIATDKYGSDTNHETFLPFKDEEEMRRYAEQHTTARIIQYVDAKIVTTVSVKVTT